MATAIARAVSNADERAEESQKQNFEKLREEILRTARKPPRKKKPEEVVEKVGDDDAEMKRENEEGKIQTEGPSVRKLLEVSQSDEDDVMFAALTKAIRFGELDPLCEIHLKIKRRCDVLQQENVLVRSVIENMKSSVNQFTSRLEHAVSPRTVNMSRIVNMSGTVNMSSTRRRRGSRPPPPPAPSRT